MIFPLVYRSFVVASAALLLSTGAIEAQDRPATTFRSGPLEWQRVESRRPGSDSLGAFYAAADRTTACAAGWRVPTVQEWMALLSITGGRPNPRGGITLARPSLAPWDSTWGLRLGGIRRGDRVVVAGRMGLYWTSTDTSLTITDSAGVSRTAPRAVGIHLYSTADGFQMEPTYVALDRPDQFLVKCVR